MIKVVNFCTRAVGERWERYYHLYDDVTTAVSQKFMAYMHRRGHQVSAGAARGAGLGLAYVIHGPVMHAISTPCMWLVLECDVVDRRSHQGHQGLAAAALGLTMWHGACPESLSCSVSCPCCAGGWLLQGKVRVDQESGELKLLVKVNSQGAGVDQRAKAVKDLKQLSGNQSSMGCLMCSASHTLAIIM
jgi:hypothetical protein